MITVADWKLAYEGFAPEDESLREALCTLGNGYFATRGAAEEASADEVHYPGTYLAGGFNRLKTDMAGQGDRERGPGQPAELAAALVPAGRRRLAQFAAR